MDFLPMKGVEYLMVITYLLLLIPFWYVLMGRQKTGAALERAISAAGPRSWFSVPEWLAFHPGHTWAQRVEGNRVRVGMDDFAHRLIGPFDGLTLPEPGDEVTAGLKGWELEADGRALGVLSPVTGRVVSINRDAADQAGSIGDDPYGSGWLLEVEVPSTAAAFKNLLQGRLAKFWTEDAADRLSRRMSPELGTVLADGGTPVAGIARAMSPEDWDRLASEILLTSD